MLNITKIGNIKNGATVGGEAVQFSGLQVTKLSRDSTGNFANFDGFSCSEKSVRVRLPFTKNLKRNFESSLVSFVLVNDSIKYYAKDIDGFVYLFPLGDDSKRPIEEMPIIRYGSTSDYKDSLEMKVQGLLYLYVLNKEGDDLIGNGTGVFFFKTQSPIAISEIKNTLGLLDSVDSEILRMADFSLEVSSKMSLTNQDQEITYTRLVAPNQKSIINAIKLNREYPELSSYFESIEDSVAKSREDIEKNAVTVKEAAKYFGGDISITVDRNDAEAVSATTSVSAKSKSSILKRGRPKGTTNKVEAEQSTGAANIAEEYKLPKMLVETVLRTFGEDRGLAFIKEKKTIAQITVGLENITEEAV